MQATISLLSERKAKTFFLTSPLIGLIDRRLVATVTITPRKRVYEDLFVLRAFQCVRHLWPLMLRITAH
jgi:hypothetical protein